MAKTVLHQAATRGFADHGWLKSHHTFSFAGYYNPDRMNFGALRVLNDDTVAGSRGFGEHPHDNMEIISIPLEGELIHRDSMGNEAVIKQGEIQVMSAGTGIYHSEYNHKEGEPVKFLQIWLFPNKRNVQPRYDQIQIDLKEKNKLHQILSPNADDEGVWIYQNAWFHMGSLDKGTEIEYQLKDKANGVYVFVLSGKLEIDGTQLSQRDGFGIWEAESFNIKASEDAQALLMEVPMLG
ncbi:pirin family protein [Mucilaginibacter sp. KACC 22063]|uniref:pirin family protein n=1 Tax=Mucilaginibacter sp. KACC 22063 TaxID=3025666 RepID=UPI0023666BBF|nr:pirin family protein [Mucilaginibacter sp. KACC 22063]WDF53897.1 pirin family protein [Mucilaginibacter sp. KACC 22063]